MEQREAYMARRTAFLGGLFLGCSLCAWLLAAVLVYFFTGKIASIQAGGGKGLRLALTDVDSLYEMLSAGRSRISVAGKEGL